MTVSIRRSKARSEIFIATCIVVVRAASAPAGPVRSVPICSGITLAASYLAVTRDQSPGFRFVLSNRTSRAIKLAEPVPSSSHWYARLHGRWLWRASSGAGGSLADARNEHGRVVVYPASPNKDETEWLTLPPHQIQAMDRNPAGEPCPANTSRAVRCALTRGRASTGWSLPTPTLPLPARNPGRWLAVCARPGAAAAEILNYFFRAYVNF